MFLRSCGLAVCALVVAAAPALGQENKAHWFSGDWYLTVGATVMRAPDFEGASRHIFEASPVISFGRAGKSARFTSRNDNISIALIDQDRFRAGINGKLIFGRDAEDELAGLDPIRFGGELGGFAEIYPTDWLRLRGAVRHGIRSHEGVVADVSADAFYDVTPDVRVSAGPRASFASADYFETYYGVDAAQSVASGLSPYTPDGGMKSAGAGGAITWKMTDAATATAFGEYERLTGPAAESSLVKERGSRDQFTLGLTLTYRFDFSL